MDRQITCITIKAAPADCTCIGYVGTIDSDYLIPVAKVIRQIEKGKDRFYVLDHETQSRVHVNIAQRSDLKYIRTEGYDTPNDKLLKVGYCNVTNKPRYEGASVIIIGIKDLLNRRLKAAKTGST